MLGVEDVEAEECHRLASERRTVSASERKSKCSCLRVWGSVEPSTESPQPKLDTWTFDLQKKEILRLISGNWEGSLDLGSLEAGHLLFGDLSVGYMARGVEEVALLNSSQRRSAGRQAGAIIQLSLDIQEETGIPQRHNIKLVCDQQ